MTNDRLNDVVERLRSDPRFLEQFRRSPRWALRGCGLSRREIRAVKAGRAGELLELGLAPEYVRPLVSELVPLPALALRNAKRLTPVALLAAASLTLAAATGAPAGTKRRAGAAGAKRRTVPTNIRGVRYVEAHRSDGTRVTGFAGRVAVNLKRAKPRVKNRKQRQRIRRKGRTGRDVEIMHRVQGEPDDFYGDGKTNRRGIFGIPGPPPPPGTQSYQVDVQKEIWRRKGRRNVAFAPTSRTLSGDF